MTSLQADDFELFGLPRQFEQDRARIDERWKQLQREAHPDRHAAQGAAAQRAAMQWSVRINEAYQRLRDPLRRAAYLCELLGAPVRAQDNTAMPAEFLLQQMQWREALQEAQDRAELDALAAEVERSRRERLQRLRQLLDEQHDAAAAAEQVRALMFIERYARDIEARYEQMESRLD